MAKTDSSLVIAVLPLSIGTRLGLSTLIFIVLCFQSSIMLPILQMFLSSKLYAFVLLSLHLGRQVFSYVLRCNRSPKGNMWSAIPVALLCMVVNRNERQGSGPEVDEVL